MPLSLRTPIALALLRAGLAAISFGEELVFAARTLVPELHSPELSWVARVRDLLTPEEV